MKRHKDGSLPSLDRRPAYGSNQRMAALRAAQRQRTQLASKPRLLDLFCGAGGAAMGYHRAGFEVVGVDIKPQPHYPFEFHQADAMSWPLDGFAAIHASPPCRAHTALKTMLNAQQHTNLLTPIRPRLIAAGVPWVIENVPGAPMRRDAILCGTMFALGCEGAELRRHRWFEASFPLSQLTPPCAHGLRGETVGVYGDSAGMSYDRRQALQERRPATVGVWGGSGGFSRRDQVQQFSTAERAEAMDIDWMTGAELSQAIPPAYTEWIGKQLLAAIQLAARATPLVPPVLAGRAAGVRGAETPAPFLLCLACDRLAEDGWPQGTGPHAVCRACADLDVLDGNPDKEYDAWVDRQEMHRWDTTDGLVTPTSKEDF